MTELTAPVGIGTDNPVATFDIGGGTAGAGGTLHIQEPANPTTITTPVQGAYLAWNALTGGTGETDFINNQGGGSGGFAFMNTPASGEPRTTLMFITGAGNVGIGTPNPAYPLHMPAGKALRIEAGTTTSDLTDYFSFGGNGTFGIDAMGVSNGRFVVENGGKVGIGTPTPRTALEIQGPLQAGWSPWLMLTNAVGNADVGVAFNTFAPAVTVANNASSVIQAQDMGNFTNDLVFLSNAGGAPSNGLVEKMRITASGNVGIGTASPTATLEVAAAPFELNDYPVVGIQGLAAAYGGKQNGRIALMADGGDGDPAQLTATGGIGGWFTGGEGNQTGGVAGLFFGGDAFLEEGGSAGIWSSGGFGGTGNNLVQGPAALFFGYVEITGELTASSKSFKIDHPLDPANKFLVHSSVESDERLTVYSGNVTTDAQGEARVQLPEWFEVLNTDFRYHLTVIGQFAQAIVSNKIADNQFGIRTDKPNVEVSWQVTGVRQDAYAKANPLNVERQKDARERGHYMDPRLHDAPENRSVSWARYPGVMKTIEDARARKLAAARRGLRNTRES